MYYERMIEAMVRNVSATFPALLVTGPRQVGKSTLLEKMAEPELFLQRYVPPVLIDEVQYAPGVVSLYQDHRGSPKTAG